MRHGDREQNLPTRYLLALLFVAIAFATRWALHPLVGSNSPFTTFTLAMIVTSIICGIGPGLLSMGVGFSLAVYFFVDPRFHFFTKVPHVAFNLVSFGIIGIVSGFIGEMVRSQRRRLRREAAIAVYRASQLRESEEKLVFALQMSQTATWAVDFRAEQIVWSSNAAPLFGRTETSVCPSLVEIEEMLHPEDRDAVHEAVNLAIAERSLYQSEHRVILNDGTIRWMLTKGQAQYGDDGEPIHMSGVIMDVTDRRLSQDAARRYERRAQLAFKAAGIGSWQMDVRTEEVFYSPEMALIMGLAPEELQGTRAQWVALLHPDDRAKALKRIVDGMTDSTVERYESEYRLFRSDGTGMRYILSRGVFERDLYGEACRIDAICVDVTDLRLAEVARRETEARLAVAVDSAALGTWDFDPTTGELVWSDRCKELFGLAHTDQVPFRRFIHLVHNQDSRRVIHTVKAVLRGDNHGFIDIEFRMVNGSLERWVRAKGRAFFDQDGKATRFIGTASDISGQRALTDGMVKAKEAADDANRAKSAFLANMSHEIRTPLNAIMGFSDMLLDPRLSEDERHDCVSTISRNGQMLARLIDDILDLSKVEAGKLMIVREVLSVSSVLAEVAQVFADMVRKNDVQLEIVTEPDVPEFIQADPVRVRQILLNIVGNAIKFTRGGRVKVTTKVLKGTVDLSASDVRLGFIVEDDGPGIATEHQGHLFQPFQQSDASTTRRYGGTGLGLALSRRLARALGGDVTLVKSALNEGATFLISLNVGRVVRESVQPLVASVRAGAIGSSLVGLHLLVVEDTPDSQFLIRHILTRAGANVDTAGDGAEGVRLAMATDYDLVLMDIQMPILDGYEATMSLRNQGFKKPIIALTAHAMKEERERTRQSGFDDHITKPINPTSLIQTLARYVVTSQIP